MRLRFDFTIDIYRRNIWRLKTPISLLQGHHLPPDPVSDKWPDLVWSALSQFLLASKKNISSSMVKNGNGCAAMTYNGENTTKWIMTCPEDLYSISFLFGQPDIMFVSNGLSSYLERFPWLSETLNYNLIDKILKVLRRPSNLCFLFRHHRALSSSSSLHACSYKVPVHNGEAKAFCALEILYYGKNNLRPLVISTPKCLHWNWLNYLRSRKCY